MTNHLHLDAVRACQETLRQFPLTCQDAKLVLAELLANVAYNAEVTHNHHPIDTVMDVAMDAEGMLGAYRALSAETRQ